MNSQHVLYDHQSGPLRNICLEPQEHSVYNADFRFYGRTNFL